MFLGCKINNGVLIYSNYYVKKWDDVIIITPQYNDDVKFSMENGNM